MHTIKNRTTVIFLIISIFITCGVSTTQAFSMSDNVKKKTEETETRRPAKRHPATHPPRSPLQSAMKRSAQRN